MNGAARRIFSEATNERFLEKMAFYGASLFMRVAINFIWRATGTEEFMKHFESKDSALKWLKVGA